MEEITWRLVRYCWPPPPNPQLRSSMHDCVNNFGILQISTLHSMHHRLHMTLFPAHRVPLQRCK